MSLFKKLTKNKIKDIIKFFLSMVGWSIFSLMATHHSLIKKCVENSSYDKILPFFEKTTGNTASLEYFSSNLFVPILLVILIFIMDFYLITDEKKRKDILPIMFFAVFCVFAAFWGLVQNAFLLMKVFSFVLMWFAIAGIKSAFHIDNLKTEVQPVIDLSPDR